MKNNFSYLGLTIVTLFFIFSCSKDDNSDNNMEQYKNGKIEFSYSTADTKVSTDTLVVFTSRGFNPSELDDYGCFKSSTEWCQLIRLNPDNIHNRTMIFFSGTDLNTLSLPYTFGSGNINRDAQINYVVGVQTRTDESGQQIVVNNTYAATTYENNFELTISSKVDGRLKGIFQGEIKNQDGDIINVKNGKFDILVVEK